MKVKCIFCGYEDIELRDYCMKCGRKMRQTSKQQEAVLAGEKRRERYEAVAKRLRGMLAYGFGVLAAILIVKAALTAIPHQEVNAYIPPPGIDAGVISVIKLPVNPASLPAPTHRAEAETPEVAAREQEIIAGMKQQALRNAPTYQLKDGTQVKGVIIRREGERAHLLTEQGRRTVPLDGMTLIE